MKVVIMAGGRGTRIAAVADDIPKPMIPIDGKPVLEHEIICLKKQGYRDICLVVGYLGDIIQEYFKDGHQLGVSIKYFFEEEPLGTAGALFCLRDVLREDFFLLNGDIMLDVDFRKMETFHRRRKAWATLLTHPNDHPYDSALISADIDGRVTSWILKEEKRHFYKNRVNAGVHILSPEVLDYFELSGKVDLDRDLLKGLIPTGRLFAYDSPEYIKDMGTPERYSMVCRDYESGKIQRKNLQNKQTAVFLDRDGTINQYCGFVTAPEQLKLLEDVSEALKLINESGYLAVVVTNQPVIARGECSTKELEEIHNKMETLLGEHGAYVDEIYYCPHHPDIGFEGERIEYKTDCDCRKPKPGLLIEAAGKYNIDLHQSYMVGDSISDMKAGTAAGCKCIYIGEDSACDVVHTKFKSLYEFVLAEIKVRV